MFSTSWSRTSGAGACALVVSIAVPFSTQANATEVLPEMVVTATKVPQAAESVLADFSVVDRQAIERSGATSISEVLDLLPGVEVVTYGQAGIYVRGADPRAVAVFLDGIRIDYQDKNGGGARLGEIPLAIVERVELVRGPLSGLYGANAMSGAVQIFTTSSDKGDHKAVEVGIGTDGLRQGSFSIRRRPAEGFGLRLAVNERSGDGYDSSPELANTPANLRFYERSVTMGVDLEFSERDALSLVTVSTQNGGDYIDQYSSRFPANLQTDHTNSHFALTWRRDWRDDLKGKFLVSSSRMATVGSLPDSYVNRTSTISYDLELEANSSLISGGVERKYDRLAAQADVYNSAAVFEGKGQNAIYVGYGRTSDGSAFQGNLRLEDDETYGSNRAAGVSYGMSLSEGWKISVGSSTGFRAPTVEQIYGGYGSLTIKPESSISKEITLRYARDESSGAIVFYKTKFKDKFGYDSSYNHTNINRASVEGVTLSGKTRWRNLDLGGSLDLMDPRNDTTGKQLNLRAKRSAAFNVSSRYGQWISGVTLRLRGPRFNEAANTNVLAGDGLVDLTSERKINGAWALKFRVSNVLNKVYRDQKEDLAPGRRVYIGLIWRD
jgi:vitamin B12 transporter